MKRFMLLCISLFYTSVAISATWQALDENEQFISYLDTDSVRVLPNPENIPAQKLSYTIKTTYKTPKRPKKKIADYTIEKYKADCLSQKTALGSLTFYINKGAKIETVQLEHDDWQAVKPESLGEKQLKKTCEIAFELPYKKSNVK